MMYSCVVYRLLYKEDVIESFLKFLSKQCARLPDDGSFVIRNMFEHFQIFYNFNFIYILYTVH